MTEEMHVTMGTPVLKESGYYVPLFLNGQQLPHNSYLKINIPTTQKILWISFKNLH